jgi:plastocyanin
MLVIPRNKGLVALSSVLALIAGCGSDDAGSGEAGNGQPAAVVVEHPVDVATAGSISGGVTFAGDVPAPVAIDMADEPTCLDENGGSAVTETVVVGSGGELANVFVYVKEGLDPSLAFPTGNPVILDQQGCTYRPHVIGLSAGQTLTVRNSDDALHNINATPTENRGFNRSQPQAGMEFQTSFPTPEIMIPIRCDVHGWMDAYVGVTSNPYHAVSDTDGTFTMDRLPPGDYVLEAWHEQYGTATQSVTVEQGSVASVTFEFNGTMARRPVPMGPALVVDHATGTMLRTIPKS